MRVIDLSNVSWRKSSYSNTSGGECVEVGRGPLPLVPVRDSKDPSRGALVFPARSWEAFVEGVKCEGVV
ncbi:DUF397 domain-containing protein [Streptomyces sp. NPDC048297]|uniref:DUF397 domain-containing protein n=1 Tax=Streptomyces sp. NPDC048297 TaxID=3365531 RepID=UPI0037214725